jgi:hypothetical protein
MYHGTKFDGCRVKGSQDVEWTIVTIYVQVDGPIEFSGGSRDFPKGGFHP